MELTHNGHTDQCNRIESPETDTDKYSQLTSDKGAKATEWRRDGLLNK